MSKDGGEDLKKKLAHELIEAVKKGDIDSVKQLAANGADVINTRHWLTNSNMLTLALSKGRSDVANYLLEQGCDIDVNDQLLIAARENDHQAIRWLVDNKADVNTKSHEIDGLKTALHYIAEIKHSAAASENARFLIAHGASVNMQDAEGRMPLHLAAKQGAAQMVKILLENGADVESEDKHNMTPMHYIAELNSASSQQEKAKILLDHGASADVRVNMKKLPIASVFMPHAPQIYQAMEEKRKEEFTEELNVLPEKALNDKLFKYYNDLPLDISERMSKDKIAAGRKGVIANKENARKEAFSDELDIFNEKQLSNELYKYYQDGSRMDDVKSKSMRERFNASKNEARSLAEAVFGKEGVALQDLTKKDHGHHSSPRHHGKTGGQGGGRG